MNLGKSPHAQHRALPPPNSWPAADRRAWDTAHRPPAQQGVDLEDEAPAARITPVRVRSYVTFLREGRGSVTVASYLGILCMTVLALFK